MKRTPSARVPSPTNTSYSGISNYRSEQYKPLRDKAKSVSTQVDPREIAKVHYDEMAAYLEDHLAKEPANARASAREKLTRLTRQQFQELSTDVYDELLRRKNNTENDEVPFLPVREDFHPKRNQARQKLATLPKSRFKDLSGDVFYELGRRYPEFREDETLPPNSPGSNYDDLDVPAPDFPQSSRSIQVARQAVMSESPYSSSPTGRRPSEENYRRRPSEDTYGNRSDDGGYGSGRRPSEDNYSRDIMGVSSSRRKPSQDTVIGLRNEERRRPSLDSGPSARRPSEEGERERDLGRRPSASVSTTSDSTSATNAQREVIIPNKSTIAEEEIEVPYGRERESSVTAGLENGSRGSRVHERSPEERFDTEDSTSGNERHQDKALDEEDEDDWSAQNRSGEEYYEKISLGRTSVASDRSTGLSSVTRANSTGGTGRSNKAGASSEETESLRRSYEFKLATMQNRLATMERDLEESRERGRRTRENADDERLRDLENELKSLRSTLEEKEVALRSVKRELDDLREEHLREQDLTARRAREDKEELESLRERCQQLELDRKLVNGSQVDPEAIDQLRSELESLVTELSDLSRQNDELMAAKESDLAIIQSLDNQLKDYKKKYEMARTELRGLKATSQMYLPNQKLDSEQLPISEDGGILDIHMKSFVSAIDRLLFAGRSLTPSAVLPPIKDVINSVAKIIEDLRIYEGTQDRAEPDTEVLRSSRERIEATLSNLVITSRSHATSSGLSPVSLLDAAASHLSAAVIDLVKTVLLRSTGNSNSVSAKNDDATKTRFNGSMSPSSLASSHLRDSYQENHTDRVASPLNVMQSSDFFSSSLHTIDDTSPIDGPEDAWAELKSYLDAQSEAIVYAIQNVLSAVRTPTPSQALGENVAQIITIVSSIIAVCKDSLPTTAAEQGTEILREMGEHANKLSEVQNAREVTKESRQIMAKSSFAIANAMKSLMKL